MRIFYAAPDCAQDRNTVDTKLWRANLYDALSDLGHELIEFEVDYQPFHFNLDPDCKRQKSFVEKNRPVFSENLLAQVRAAHRRKPIDLFFSYFYSAYVEPDAIREIGRMGIPTVNWFCNASYQFHLVEEIAPAYDYCLVPEKFRLNDYRRVGATPIYCQEAANPNMYKPYPLAKEFDVTFVGQKYGTRPLLMGSLHQEGVDARAWGPHWQNEKPMSRSRQWRHRVKHALRGRSAPTLLPAQCCGPPLEDEELIKMYSRSHISLGFTAVAHVPKDGSPPIQQVRLRDFEATMSGAFYLVEAFDELADFFEPDKEIVFFENSEELIEKSKYYLAHPLNRERIRQAGLRRARAEHTWQKRFEMVFAEMGIANNAKRECGPKQSYRKAE